MAYVDRNAHVHQNKPYHLANSWDVDVCARIKAERLYAKYVLDGNWGKFQYKVQDLITRLRKHPKVYGFEGSAAEFAANALEDEFVS